MFSKVINCALIFKNFAGKEISSKVSLLISAWDEIDEEVKKELKQKTPEVYDFLQNELKKLKS